MASGKISKTNGRIYEEIKKVIGYKCFTVVFILPIWLQLPQKKDNLTANPTF
jgi:hypothetical protein